MEGPCCEAPEELECLGLRVGCLTGRQNYTNYTHVSALTLNCGFENGKNNHVKKKNIFHFFFVFCFFLDSFFVVLLLLLLVLLLLLLLLLLLFWADPT